VKVTTVYIIINTNFATVILLLDSFMELLEGGVDMRTKVLHVCPGHDSTLRLSDANPVFASSEMKPITVSSL
jgi:hypothetical protein